MKANGLSGRESPLGKGSFREGDAAGGGVERTNGKVAAGSLFYNRDNEHTCDTTDRAVDLFE